MVQARTRTRRHGVVSSTKMEDCGAISEKAERKTS